MRLRGVLIAALALVACAVAADQNSACIVIIVVGVEFATLRTPVFVRSLLASRSAPIQLHVIGDKGGLSGFRTVWQSHAVAQGLVLDQDTVVLHNMQQMPEVQHYLATIHPTCHSRGLGYLFCKVFASELLSNAEKLIIIDPDTVVLSDVAELWSEFDHFGDGVILRWHRTRAIATTIGSRTRQTTCSTRAGWASRSAQGSTQESS